MNAKVVVVLAATLGSCTPELTPQQRINAAFEDAASRPLQTVANKGDTLVPIPVQTLTCTKRFCEPHRKGLDHIKPFEGSNQ